MNDPIDAVRSALRELADEGRPIDMGGRVLTRMRNRRRRRTLVASTGLITAVVAGSLVWPVWLRDSEPPAAPTPTVSPTPTVEVWPPFTGTGAVAAPGAPSEQLLVAAYSTGFRDPVQVLDPTSGAYRPVAVDNVKAVSPDLHFAVVSRVRLVPDPDGAGPLEDVELGILDTATGRILGRLDTALWTDLFAGVVVSGASWSPDGGQIVIGVRRGVPGQGWLAERLVFVDVATGAARAVEITPGETLEPIELLGWTTDGGGIVLAAEGIGTDEVEPGHLIYDEGGSLIAEVEWPDQAGAMLVVGRDDLGLISVDGERLSVVDIWTGDTRPYDLNGRPLGTELPIAWRGGEVIVREQECEPPPAGCSGGTNLVAVALDTGARRLLHVLDESQYWIVVAAARGSLASGSPPTW